MSAEFAVALPAVIVVLSCCVGAIQVASQQVQLTDAAADAARTLARGDSLDLAAARVARVSDAAEMASSHSGEFVCVSLTAPAAFPAARSLGFSVAASGCALAGGL